VELVVMYISFDKAPQFIHFIMFKISHVRVYWHPRLKT